MLIEWASFSMVCLGGLALAAGLASGPQLRTIGNLLIAGALMRIVGVFARHAMIFDLYGGSGDAARYFSQGRIIADHLRVLDFSVIGSGMWGSREWGTQAIRYASGLVITFVGPSMRGAFLVFSIAAFVGLVCMTIAFARSNGPGSMRWSAGLLFFWPSLWFWPSSIGKEAVLLLGIGLVTMGYVGTRERIHWVPITTGFALVLAIRPHLAGVLAVAACVAEWTAREWTVRRLTQTAIASTLAVWLLSVSFNLLGIANTDVDSLQTFVRDTAEQTNQGGSSFARSSSLVVAVPMAFVNLMGRPFITEAHNTMARMSALEMMGFWGLVLYSRHNLLSIVRSWRSNRLVRFALPFSLLYILMIGLTFQNFGIMARQRTLVMPALLLLLATTASATRTVRVRATRQRRVWRPAPGPALGQL